MYILKSNTCFSYINMCIYRENQGKTTNHRIVAPWHQSAKCVPFCTVRLEPYSWQATMLTPDQLDKWGKQFLPMYNYNPSN